VRKIRYGISCAVMLGAFILYPICVGLHALSFSVVLILLVCFDHSCAPSGFVSLVISLVLLTLFFGIPHIRTIAVFYFVV